jgi:long-subunit fatty acid transport protein
MKTSRIYWLVILSIIGLQAVQAQYAEDALRFSQFGSAVGARSQAMGNTIVGIADDYSALFGNPAGLSQQKSFEFSIGLSRLGYGNDVTFFGKKTTDDNSVINLNNLGIVYPIATERGGLTFAFGFGRVASFNSITSFDGFNPSSSIIQSLTSNINTYNYSDVEYQKFLDNSIPYQLFLANKYLDTVNRDEGIIPLVTGRVQQHGTIRESGGINNWSIGGGIDVAPNLSFGITLNLISGSYNYDRDYNETEPTQSLYYQSDPASAGYFNKFEWQSTIHSDISGFNAIFALMFRQPKYKIGLTVHTPTSYDISETFSDSYNSHFVNVNSLDPLTFPDGSTEYKVITPWIISGGISIRPIEWLLLAGDAEYTDWTQIEFNSDNQDLIRENNNIKDLMRDTWNLRGGAEVSIWSIGLKLRAGIEWKPSPWKDDPSEYDQLIYTAGIGYEVDESSSINISYALGDWKTFRDNYYLGTGTPSRTSESVTTNTVNLTFSHKF